MSTSITPENVAILDDNIKVYESIRRFSLKGLSELIRNLMDSMDDALFDLSEKVESDQERNMYFEAMREIRIKRQNIKEEFDSEILNRFTELRQRKAVSQVVPADEELTLLGQDEMEDNLAIDNMINKARPLLEDDLFALSERMKVVLKRKELKDTLNPLDPKAICDSFHNACAQIDSDIQVKLILYKSMP